MNYVKNYNITIKLYIELTSMAEKISEFHCICN